MKHNLLKSVIISVILLMGVSNAWAWWFVPGSWNGWDSKEASSGGVAQMNGSNTITFYNVPAGSYEMKLIKGSYWGNGNYTNKSNSYISSVSKGNGDNDKITLSKACDLTFTITDQNNWKCDVSASDPSYYIKYNWNGSGWAWSGALTASNNYSCTGQYGESASFDHTRKSSTDESGTNKTGTTVNSPTKGDKCVFTYNTSTNALTITRCNKANQSKIYFDNSKTNWANSNIYFIIGYDKPTAYSKVYKMSNISNTLLWYTDLGTDNWDDATYYAFIAADNEWSNGYWGSSNLNSAQHYTTAYTAEYDLGNNGCYYFTPKTGDNNTTFTIEYKESHSNIQKYTAKQAAKTRNTINDSYTDVNGTWPTALKLQGTHLTGFGATNSGRNEISSSSSSGTNSYDAVTTGKITHTYNTISGNYIFEGWGTGNTPSTTNATYDYNITAATTVYAFFTKAVTMTFTPKGEYGSSTVSGTATGSNSTTKSITSGAKVAVGSTINLTANPATGYQVEGWYSDADCTQQLQKGGNKYNAGVLSTAKTVYVKFEELSANTVYLKLTGNWKSAAARYAAYVYNGSKNEWIDMEVVGCSEEYYKVNIPARYTNIIFGRMDPKQSENSFDYDTKKVIWNQTTNYNIQDNVNKCFTIGEDQWGNSEIKATGTWDTYTSTITLTLKSSSNGKYHIIHKGSRYESSLTEDVNIDLPLNAEIIISDVADARPGYTFKKRYIKIGTNAKEEAATNTPYQLCGSTSITADFVTVIPHTVYFKPNDNWTGSSARFAVYVYDEVGNDKWYNMTSATGGYYTCTIEAGWSKLIFVRMNPANNTNKFEENYSWNQTYSHAIPVNRFNTYVLYDDKWGADDNEGYWTHTPTFTNSYRLRYVEQVVEKTQTWKTTITETLASHRIDDVIPQKANSRDTISYYINVDGDNPEVVLEQYNGSTWEVKERRMINGPLETTADMAMLPGRRNTSGSGNPQLIYDNGIDAITESGVWNFIIVQDGSGNATIKTDETHLYTGDYYIRTNNTAGGWNTYTHLDNHMKLSTNAESGYTHYYCKWVDISTSDNAKNVKYIVANDYSINVSKELAKDDYTADDGNLVENANVRWTWNDKTGERSRAYIQGAFDPSTHDRLNNIVLDYTTDGTTDPADETLDDSGDWIYTKDVTVRSGATLVDLTATYPSKTQGGVTSGLQTFIEGPITLLEGMSDQEYTVRVTYDFKNNKATTFLIPGASEIATAVDVMIERVDQGVTTAVQAPISGITKDETTQSFRVCAVMSFTKEHLNDKSLHNDLRQFYWISFPFNVNIEDVYGFGTYGVHWILEEYNGARRAKDGLWLDSPSFWEFILDPKDKQIEANKGYLLCLDLDLLGNNSDVFANTNKVSLYFPATETVTGINAEYTITEVPVSTHIRTEKRANRHIYDSNWNLIGVPSYANKDQSSSPTNLQYFYDYKYNESTNKMEYVAKSSTNGQFNSMYAYFVQWGGTLNWTTLTGTDNTPRELAAKRNAAYEVQEYNLRLELQQDYKVLDQTFVDMQEDGVTAAFDLNKDMTKIINAGANIYTLAGTEMIQLAGNVLPIANIVIPVGVQVATAGEYTFAMPDGTDGVVVELIDYEANITTNLLLSDYTVNLPAGANETRFALSVKPNKTATSVDNISGATGDEAKKYIIDGVLYLQRDGALYDAQGHIVH